jgi:uncharacterized protein (DUF849 family)
MPAIAVVREMKACLNGARRPGEHPALPLTAEEIGAAAAEAVTAGAEALHVHPRDRRGEESLAAADIGTAVAAVGSAVPGVPVGVSTGLWIADGDVDVRRRAVSAWRQLPAGQRPDFASVNAGEPGFADLADVLEGADIAVEAGVWSPEDAEVLGRRPVHRVLVEIVTGLAATAVERADEVLRRLDEIGSTAPRLLHGEDEACWPLVAYAGRLGLPTRIGLEDTLVDEHGAPARSNADLVRRALGVWRAGTTLPP